MPQKILVVDDAQPFRTTIVKALRRSGFEPIEAADGATGLQLARSQSPDLILSDVDMPNLNGTDLLKTLRNDPATASIPFILMTDQPGKASLRQGMFLGADDYLPKPFSVPDMLLAINGRLRRRQQMRQQAEAKEAQLHAALGAVLPHELLTPLAGILGLAELIQADCATLQPAEIFKMTADIQLCGERLLRLIQNYLYFMDLENLRLDPARAQSLRRAQTPSTRALIEAVAQSTAQKAHRPGDLVLDLVEVPVAMRENYLKKIVEELIDNAFKFSKPGTPVTVITTAGPKEFTLSVRDLGRGMTCAQIAQIGAYHQFDRQRHEQQGLGLGLAIVQRLVELHQGTLAIQTPLPATGTTVELRLPAPPAPEPPTH